VRDSGLSGRRCTTPTQVVHRRERTSIDRVPVCYYVFDTDESDYQLVISFFCIVR